MKTGDRILAGQENLVAWEGQRGTLTGNCARSPARRKSHPAKVGHQPAATLAQGAFQAFRVGYCSVPGLYDQPAFLTSVRREVSEVPVDTRRDRPGAAAAAWREMRARTPGP